MDDSGRANEHSHLKVCVTPPLGTFCAFSTLKCWSLLIHAWYMDFMSVSCVRRCVQLFLEGFGRRFFALICFRAVQNFELVESYTVYAYLTLVDKK